MARNLCAHITAASVAKLAPGDVLRDNELKGFGVRRRSGAASYFLQTRIRGRLRWITIGTHGSPWSPAAARKEAMRLLAEVKNGADPGTAKMSARSAPTFAEAAERFMATHGQKLKPRTREEYQRLIDKTLVPVFGRRLLIDIETAEIDTFHARLAATPRKANFALAVLSKLMTWAEDHGLRPPVSNPCAGVKKFKERRRQRFLSPEEIRRLGDVLDTLDSAGLEPPPVTAAIRLLLLTGCRLNEVLTLQWQHVDLGRSLLHLPDSKTGPKVVYLNDHAKAVLMKLERFPDNAHVIVGSRSGGHLVNLQKPWRRIRSEAGLPEVRLHDLRHSFASVAAANGASLLLIGKLLGHSQPQTTARYAHLVNDPVREANEAIGKRIAGFMTSREE